MVRICDQRSSAPCELDLPVRGVVVEASWFGLGPRLRSYALWVRIAAARDYSGFALPVHYGKRLMEKRNKGRYRKVTLKDLKMIL